jgi:hypothetical protein
MAEILALQTEDPDETPGQEKASRLSIKWCRNSYVSVAICFVK